MIFVITAIDCRNVNDRNEIRAENLSEFINIACVLYFRENPGNKCVKIFLDIFDDNHNYVSCISFLMDLTTIRW